MKDIPAFPCEWDYINSSREVANGMTLRDYIATKAMMIILPKYDDVFDDDTGTDDDPTFPEILAKDAYTMADAMLKVRGK